MNERAGEGAEPRTTDEDRKVASEVIARLPNPPPADSAKYVRLVEDYARLRVIMRPDRFALLHGLRKPGNRRERLEKVLHAEDLSPEECVRRLQEDAHRPIDLEMLLELSDVLIRATSVYSEMLVAVVAAATAQTELHLRPERERIVDVAQKRLIAVVKGTTGEEVTTVTEFLLTLRANAPQPVCWKDMMAPSAHALAYDVFGTASEAWKGYREIAHRSRTDPAYDFEVTASRLFFDGYVQPPKLPPPKHLLTLLKLERSQAIAALKKCGEPDPDLSIRADRVEITCSSIKVDRGSSPIVDVPSKRWPTKPLDPIPRAVLQVFESLGPGDGLTPEELADRLIQLKPPISRSESSIRRDDIPALLNAGVPLVQREGGKRKPWYLREEGNPASAR